VSHQPASVVQTSRTRRGRRPARVLLVAALGSVVVLLPACGRSGASGVATPHFVDDTAAAGVDHRYDGDFDYFVGGGVAAFDCDADGRDELFVAGGTQPAALYHNDSPVGGALRFSPLRSPVTDLTAVTGAYPIDIDSDGTFDLVVLRRGGDVVLRGLGGCRFAPANQELGIDVPPGWTTAFSATWEGTNAMPTLAFGRYLVPGQDTCDQSWLVRPESATATRYAAPVALTPGYCTLSMLFSDWSHSGHRDLRVSNDRHYYLDGEEQLWRIALGQPPTEYTRADGWQPLQIWGMGIASEDLTGDGRPEVFLTSQGDNKLQTLAAGAAGPTYEDIALRNGVTAQRPYVGDDVLPSTAWHPEFADVNNDTLPDLLVTKGNVEAQPDQATRDPSDLFLGQPGGSFVQRGEQSGIVDYQRARGAAVVDLNLDGLLDMVIVHRRANITLWRNAGSGDANQPKPMGRWIDVRLQQPAPNVDAIGAWVDVRTGDATATREVTVGGGHVSGELGWLHSGLGSADRAEVRVEWPDGTVGPWMAVRAGERVTIVRGETAPREWTPEG
jgi:enediyne biosynthesis protein E4